MSRWRKSHEQGPNAGKSLVCSKLKIRPHKSGKTESRLVVTLGWRSWGEMGSDC